MYLLTVKDVNKKQDDGFLLRDISFELEEGQKIAIAGETGSGKTTLAKIVAGLGQADSGEVLFEGKPVKGINDKLMPGHKGIAYLSQHFELPNRYRVSELLAYANDLTDEQSAELYHICRVDHLLHRWSQTLSGGEKQRVALAKLLTTIPGLIVLDEPFSNLDLIHTNQLKLVLDDIAERWNMSYILISHEAEDILPWADIVFIMKDGRIVEQGSPQKIYTEPETAYTAGLFGKYNLLPGHNGFLRPEQLFISADKNDGFPALIKRVLYIGDHYEAEVLIDETLITIRTNKTYEKGQHVFVSAL